MMDQQDSGGEGIGLGERVGTLAPGAQRRKRSHELLVGAGSAVERPALPQQPPAAVVLGRDLQPDRAGGLLRDRHTRRRDPDARQRAAEAGILQRLARGVAIPTIADQQQLEAAGPAGGRRIVDMSGRGLKGLPPRLHQPVEAVAADLAALEPAVGGEP